MRNCWRGEGSPVFLRVVSAKSKNKENYEVILCSKNNLLGQQKAFALCVCESCQRKKWLCLMAFTWKNLVRNTVLFGCYCGRNCGRLQKLGTAKQEPAQHAYQTHVDKGCPYDCGLCEDHLQQVCCVLLEVTQRCNLHCPVCFASAGGLSADPDLAEIGAWYDALMGAGGPFNINYRVASQPCGMIWRILSV